MILSRQKKCNNNFNITDKDNILLNNESPISISNSRLKDYL